MLYGKNVILGVSGGIAAYKSCEIVSRLKKLGADVDVIMTANAAEFVAPLTFETLSDSKVVTDTFQKREEHDVHHVSLAKRRTFSSLRPQRQTSLPNSRRGLRTICSPRRGSPARRSELSRPQ